MRKRSAYARAGVNIDEKVAAISSVKKMVQRTAGSGVLSGIGSFGGFFASPGRDHALVASTDGVGTKLKVAILAGRHDTVGQDIVNHCVNDILVHGARPLFFLDYFGTSCFRGKTFRDVVSGICKACRENGCALIGGETAELPALYPAGEYDLVGTIVGAAPKRDLVTGKGIRSGDAVIGLASSGLHTNGYSLARKVIFDTCGLRVGDLLPGTRRKDGDALLAVHRSYLKPVFKVMEQVSIRGMAHITGGGFYDNIPRVLPEGTGVTVDSGSWKVPPLFRFIQEHGRVDREEMYRVFNMGIGYVLIVRERDAVATIGLLRAAKARPILIGRVTRGDRKVVVEG